VLCKKKKQIVKIGKKLKGILNNLKKHECNYLDIYYFRMDENSIKLLTILTDYEIQIDNNNLLLQNKIKKKIIYIKYLQSYGFKLFNNINPNSNTILDNINKYCNSTDLGVKLVYNPELDRILGDIIHNSYINSDFQLLLSNLPLEGEIKNGKIVQIDTQVIADSLEEFVGENNVIQVLYLPNNKYLCKLKTDKDAKYIQERLNNMIINDKQIVIDYIAKQTCSNTVVNANANANANANKHDSQNGENFNNKSFSNNILNSLINNKIVNTTVNYIMKIITLFTTK
jgi:hypothetical protein